MPLDNNSIVASEYTGVSTIPPQNISSDSYPYGVRDNNHMFQEGINFSNVTPYITYSGSQGANSHSDPGRGVYPPFLIWKFGAGLFIVFISAAIAIISYSLGSKIGFLISVGSLSIGAFIIALALLNGQEIDDSGKL